VAVIAERFWPAKLGRDKLIVDWDLGPNAALSTEQMLRDFTEMAKNPGTIAKKRVILRPLSDRGENNYRGVRRSVSGARDDGAAELRCRFTGRRLRNLDRNSV